MKKNGLMSKCCQVEKNKAGGETVGHREKPVKESSEVKAKVTLF